MSKTKDKPFAKVLRIAATREGHRRAGMAHSRAPAFHPAGTFTEAQAEALKADPALIVDEFDEMPGEEKDAGKGGKDKTPPNRGSAGSKPEGGAGGNAAAKTAGKG